MISREGGLHVAEQRLELGRGLDLVGQLLDLRHEVGLGLDELAELHPLGAVDQDPQRAVGHLDHARDRAGHAHVVEVVGPGFSISPSRDATITSIRLPPSTSLTSLIERSWPTASGVSVSGNGHAVLERQHRQRLGQAAATASSLRPALGRRDLDHSPASSIGTRRAVLVAPGQRHLHHQDPVLVAGLAPPRPRRRRPAPRCAGTGRARSRSAGTGGPRPAPPAARPRSAAGGRGSRAPRPRSGRPPGRP